MIPAPRRPSTRFSLPALGLILSCILLAIILGVVTWRNLDREERLMENFLRKEGQTLIRAIEAGARTTMMMGSKSANLKTLVRKTAQEETVAYILVVDEHGQINAASGSLPSSIQNLPVAQAISGKSPMTRLTRLASNQAVFEVTREFNPVGENASDSRMRRRWPQWCAMGGMGDEAACRQAIFVGLYTREFEAARREDVKQSLIMGGVLLLFGAGGFYFLFLSQESRVAQRTLENMELYTRNVIESMPAGLITLDEQGRITSLNERARDIFGHQEESFEGKHLNALAGEGRCEIESLLQDGQEFTDKPMECQAGSGENIPVKVSASLLRDRKGAPLGRVLIVRDMREIRAMEEALERSRRMAALGRMAAGIAHEIRNPLGTLRGFAQFFRRRSDDDTAAREYADLMVGEVDRLNRTVSALLQFSRPREPEYAAVDLGELLQRTARLMEEDMAAHRVTLKVDQPVKPVAFSADPDLLTQVLINLLQNGFVATQEGGEIRLGGARENQDIRLWVQDFGRGMAAEERERMFDPFYTTRKEGTGLGLAVVQQIIEQHRGRIEVESAPGEGTLVEVILPAGENYDKA
ncbi:MAG: nitrogen regulation protein NR(II) [Geoalkalibacter sp.]|jgi:two-component system sensor histidine kinase HydH|uniref:two-component system sensor histidine kinase NtrB n=1 Tax=Geoalkalibacter sp. TaxID=3041440 RepID=UPI002A95AC14|nr:ATP-binding protein [Thermodesulfobacteriota bacterium]